jgi:hypothetical protein
LSAVPIKGNTSSATEFNTNTVPMETAISSSLAPEIGATAAIALPPQIAVPVEIRNEMRRLTFSSLPSPHPSSMAKLMLAAV